MKISKNIIFFLILAFVAIITISQITVKEVSPADMNTQEGVTFITAPPENLPVREVQELRVEGYELEVISENSDIGKKGELLLTLKGTGFILSSLSPTVVFHNEITIQDTEVNAEGTELYVILKLEIVTKLVKGIDLKEGRVKIGENKEGSPDSAKFTITNEAFKNIKDMKFVSLKYRNGFFVREK
jgi:hypothetical protein